MFASPSEQAARASMARIFGDASGSAAATTAAIRSVAAPLKEVSETASISFDFSPGHAWERITDNIDIKWLTGSSSSGAHHADDWMSRAHHAMSQYAPNMPSNVQTWFSNARAFMANHWHVILMVGIVISIMLMVATFKIAKRILAYIRARRAGMNKPSSLHLVSGPALAAGSAVMAASSGSKAMHNEAVMAMKPSMWTRFRAYVYNMANRMAMHSFMCRVKHAAMNMASKTMAFVCRWTPAWLIMIGVQIAMFWLRLVIALSNLWYRCKCFLMRGKEKTIHMPSGHDAAAMRAHLAQHDATARSIMQADMLSYQKMDELRAAIASVYYTTAAQLRQDGKPEAASIFEQSCHELLRTGGGGSAAAAAHAS